MKQKSASLLVVSAIGLAAVVMVTAAVGNDRESQARKVTISGRIVDLHGFLSGKYRSSDKARCTRDCLQAGVPAALETPDGLFVLGHGMRGPQKLISKFAFKNVEVSGTLYEHAGLRYINMTGAKQIAEPSQNAAETSAIDWTNEAEEGEVEEEEGDEDEEDEDPEEEDAEDGDPDYPDYGA